MQVFLADSGGHVRAAAEKLIAQATQWSCSGNRNELWERDFWAQHQGRAGKCIQIKHKKEGEKVFKHKQAKKETRRPSQDAHSLWLNHGTEKEKTHKKNKTQAPQLCLRSNTGYRLRARTQGFRTQGRRWSDSSYHHTYQH